MQCTVLCFADLSAFDETLGGQANMRPEVEVDVEMEAKEDSSKDASWQQKVFFNLIFFTFHFCVSHFLMKLKIIKRNSATSVEGRGLAEGCDAARTKNK